MRRVIFGGACSLDGYFARDDGRVDWLRMSPEVQRIIAEMWPRFDVMIMGRKTWAHAMEQFSDEELEKANAMSAGMRSYVFSRSIPEGKARGGYEIVNTDPAEFVRELQRREGKDIMVMGGGELGCYLLDAGVVDEIGFNIQPVLLGSGISVWNRMSRQIDLALIECRQLKGGFVYVRYAVESV